MAAVKSQNAGFGIRFVAFLIDVVVYWIFAWVLALVFNLIFGNPAAELTASYQKAVLSGGNYDFSAMDMEKLNQAAMQTNIRSSIIGLVYTVAYIYMIVTKGQTLGKMALNLKVVDVNTGKNLDVLHAILREVVGKLISAVGLFLGFFWVIWDSKKEGWHDKISNSHVIKLK